MGGAARFAVVDLLSRMKKADDKELGAIHRQHPQHSPGEILHPWEIARANLDGDDDDDEPPLVVGLFGSHERSMFTQEILQQVVIGMGRLDVDYDAEGEQTVQPAPPEDPSRGPAELDSSNPYFPPISSIHPQPHGNYTSPYSATSGLQTITPPSHRAGLFPNPTANIASSPGTEFPSSIEESQTSSARSTAGLHGGLSPLPIDIRGPSPTLNTTWPPQDPSMDVDINWFVCVVKSSYDCL